MADPSLSDMMTALSRAHGAGNVGDAASIAQMIKASYPQETQVMVGSTPRPPNPADAAMSMLRPAYAPSSIAAAPLIQSPGASFGQPSPNASPPPGVAGLNGEGGAGGPAGAGNWAQRTLSDLSDFTRGVVNALPGGNQAAAAFGAGARNLASLTGAVSPTTYSDVLANVQGGQAQAAQNSPTLNALGGVAGNVDAMALGGGLAEGGAALAARSTVPFLAPAARAAQGAADYLGAHPFLGGAAAGAAGGAINGVAGQINGTGSVFDTAAQTALGALGGAVIGKGADLVITKLAPAAARGWQLLAEKLGSQAASGQLDALATTDAARAALRTLKIDPDELATLNAQQVRTSGGPVPLAASLPQYVQGKLAQMAKTNPELGTPIADASDAWRAQGPTQVPGLIHDAVSGVPHFLSPTGQSGVQNIADLNAARGAKMTAAMDPIRGQAVPISNDGADALTDPTVQSAVGGRMKSALRGRINDAVASVDKNGFGSLSVDDLDQLRQTLGRYAGSADPAIADAATDARNAVMTLAGGPKNARTPYGQALDQYANHSAYIEGFQHGQAGSSLSDVADSAQKLAQPTGPAYRQGHASGLVSGLASKAAESENGAQSVLQTLAQNNAMRSDLAKAYGQPAADRLANIGSTMSQATSNLNKVAPTTPISAPEHDVSGNVGRAALGLAVHSHFGFLHNAYHAIMGMVHGGMSDAAAAKLGNMLADTDPRAQAQAVNVLRARGAADADIARVRSYIAGAAGVNAASRISGQ